MSNITRYRYVGGNTKETIGGDNKIYSAGDYVQNVGGASHINSKGGTEWSNEVEEPPVVTIETTRVRLITCVEELEEGCDNSGNRGGIRSGVVYGNTYHFEVTEFTDGEPLSEHSIKWKLSRMNREEGEIRNENLLKNKNYSGKKITITFTTPDLCGEDLVLQAYIQSEEEAPFVMYMHYKFKWFDRELLIREIGQRTTEGRPWLINQSATSLCGMACIFYLFAENKPEEYRQFALDLHRTGEVTYGSYTVKPDENVYNRRPFRADGNINVERSPSNTNVEEDNSKDYYMWHGANGIRVPMPLVDYVTMASVRNTESSSYKGDDNDATAINWPQFMIKLCEKFLGYNDMDYTFVPTIATRDTSMVIIRKQLQEIIDQLNAGYKLILLINSNLIDPTDKPFTPFSFDFLRELFKESPITNYKRIEEYFSVWNFHWVVLDTPIEVITNIISDEEASTTLDFNVITWGTNETYLRQPITLEHFIINYYGYIKVK